MTARRFGSTRGEGGFAKGSDERGDRSGRTGGGVDAWGAAPFTLIGGRVSLDPKRRTGRDADVWRPKPRL